MNLKYNFKKKLRQGRVGAVLSALLGLVLLCSSGIINLSYDLLVALRPAILVDEVVIVYMDEQSHSELGQPYDGPWDRSLHARLLKQLTAVSARAVVFDVLFAEPGQPEATRELAAAMAANGNVIVAAVRRMDEQSNDVRGWRIQNIQNPVEALGSVARVGLAEIAVDGEAVRRINEPNTFPSLAQAVAETVEGRLRAGPRDRQAAGDAQPGQTKRHRWVNFYGPPGVIPNVSYSRALNQDVPNGLFSGKIVFIGANPVPGARLHEFATPFTRCTGSRSPGVEIQATECLNLLRQDWLTRTALSLEIGLMVAFGLAFGFGLGVLGRWTSIAVGLGSSLAVAALAAALCWQGHIWFPWLVVSLGQIPCALACAVFAGRRGNVFACGGGSSGSESTLAFPA